MASIYNSYPLYKRADSKAAKPTTINDTDRAGFVENEEGWYNAHRRSRQPLRTFVRENRAAIDKSMREAGY